MRRLRDDLPEPHPTHPDLHVPRHTDVLGEVLAVDDDGVLVRTRRGDVRVPAADIVLGKLVPPPPAAGGTGRPARSYGVAAGVGAGPQMILFCGL